MKEHIYTIPINEAFEAGGRCPLCRIFETLEKNEVDRITGAAMMEPSVRVLTNKQGFCFKHFEMIANNGKRHPTALILQSHLEETASAINKKKGSALAKYLTTLSRDCYICNRLSGEYVAVAKNLVWLYANDEDFAEKFKKSDLCFEHAALLLRVAEKDLQKKKFAAFCDDVAEILSGEIAAVKEDVDWFCKKFDYRFKDLDWKNSKDSIERTILLLTGKATAKLDK